MLPVLYNNNYQIVQTTDAVMIMVEMIHDVRVIRIERDAQAAGRAGMAGRFDRALGRRHAGGGYHQFQRPATLFTGRTENLHMIERFQRVDQNTILYRATIDDPGHLDQAVDHGVSVRRDAGPVYEYACHEGNYAMADILGGARKMETQTTKH